MSAHRISYQHFKGEIPEGKLVLHTCDNKKCVNPDHLFVGTHRENTYDMINKGRMASFKGEGNSRAKLSAEDVLQIRKLLIEGETQTDIAKKFGLKQSTISDIKRRKNWSHL